MQRRPFGNTALMVTPLALGGGRLARGRGTSGIDQAVEVVAEVFAQGINFIDTAPLYGDSEERIGIALAQLADQVPNDLVLETKLGHRPREFDYSYEQARTCLPVSLERLGVERVSIALIHDVELAQFDDVMNGAFRALAEFRDQGLVDCIGVSGGPVELITRYLETGQFDCFLSHNRYTLLDRAAASLFERARQLGLGIVNAAPFGSGLLANPSSHDVTHAYQRAPAASRARALAAAAVCERFRIPLAQAAVAFSTSSDLVDVTCAGACAPGEIRSAAVAALRPLPEEFITALESQVPPNFLDDVEAWRQGAPVPE